MLLLSRRSGQSIMIGDDIKITVSSVYGGQVRIGVEAPKEVPVDREEVRAQKNAASIKEIARDHS